MMTVRTSHIARPRSGRDLGVVLFGIFLLVYVVIQIATTANTLRYFPGGFWTEGYYHPLAVNLLKYGSYGFGAPPFLELSTHRPPLYAAALAILYSFFGIDETVGVVFNNVLLTGLIVVTFLAGRTLHTAVGLIAALVLMLDTIYLAEANRNQSDLLFSMLITLTLFFTLRALKQPLSLVAVAAAGLALGLAVFTRAAGLYLWLPLCLTLCLAHWRRTNTARLGAALAIVLGLSAVFVVPWMIRNHSVSGNADYASMKSSHLVGFYAPLFIAKRDGTSVEEATLRIARAYKDDPEYQRLDTGGKQKFLNALGERLIRENWVYALSVLPDNIPRMFLSYASESIAVHLEPERFQVWSRQYWKDHSEGQPTSETDRRKSVLRYYVDEGFFFILGFGIFLKGLNAAILVLAGVGGILLLRSHDPYERRVGILVILFFGALIAVSILVTQGRFRLPVMPGLTLAAAFAAVTLWPRVQPLLRRRAPGSRRGGCFVSPGQGTDDARS
jgi:4-amino-4-deoxy-L-arabinose transferase-like glycosyltransferase